MTTQTLEPDVERQFDAEALVGRLFEQTVGAFELFCVYIGERLGLYRSLAADRSATPDEFARRAGIAPRYAMEWLEQQTTAGILEVDDPSAAADNRRYSLPTEHRAPRSTRTASASERSCPATSCPSVRPCRP